MSIAAVSANLPIAIASPTEVAGSLPSSNTAALSVAATDSTTISPEAQQASDSGAPTFADYERSVREAQNRINAYGHQVVWQLDNNVPVTGPGGNTSGGVATLSSAGAQLVNTQATSALGAEVSLVISGNLGITQLSFAAGTKLSALASAFNNVTASTGVSAATSGAVLKFDSTGSGANQFVTVTAVEGSFTTVANTSSGALAETIANGIAASKSGLLYPYGGLTDAQYAQLDAGYRQLNADQTQIQTFIAKKTTANYNSSAKQLSNKINAFEHQITWQIDHGVSLTAPAGSTTSATSTLSQTIADGYSALEGETAQTLGALPPQLAGQFQQLEQRLSNDQIQFTGFAARRLAYRVANLASGATKDVAA